MPRQVLHAQAEIKIFLNARMLEVEPSLQELIGHGVGGGLPLPRAHEFRKLVYALGIETHGFAHLARRGASAISNDVSGHGRA